MNKLLIISILYKTFKLLLDKLYFMLYNKDNKRKEEQQNEEGHSTRTVIKIN